MKQTFKLHLYYNSKGKKQQLWSWWTESRQGPEIKPPGRRFVWADDVLMLLRSVLSHMITVAGSVRGVQSRKPWLAAREEETGDGQRERGGGRERERWREINEEESEQMHRLWIYLTREKGGKRRKRGEEDKRLVFHHGGEARGNREKARGAA